MSLIWRDDNPHPALGRLRDYLPDVMSQGDVRGTRQRLTLDRNNDLGAWPTRMNATCHGYFATVDGQPQGWEEDR
ncbi:hypothetical protein GCM10010199_21700 [Dactylosporangium roseum]